MGFKVKTGTKFIKREMEAQEKRRRESGMRIPRFFISGKWDEDKKRDIPIVPLIDEPAYVMSHTGSFGSGGKMLTYLCLNDPETKDGDCPICKAIANGANYPVARVEYIWIILDKTPYTRTYNGKEIEVNNTLKFLPLSVKRASFLSLLDEKYGIKNRLIRVTSQGSGNGTTWVFEYDLANSGIEGKNGKMRKFKLSDEMLEEAMERLPEEYQDLSFDEILAASLEKEAEITEEEFATRVTNKLGRRFNNQDDDEDEEGDTEDIKSRIKGKLQKLNSDEEEDESSDSDDKEETIKKKSGPLSKLLLRKKNK